MGRLRTIVVFFLLAALAAGAGMAQQTGLPVSAILTIDSERLFADSQFGKRVIREIEAEQSVLRAENRNMEARLTEEELALTERRNSMTAKDFRAVAEAFDERVERIRDVQDRKALEIQQRREQEENLFVQAARPVLAALMRQAGASVILEQRSILLSSSAIDVTDIAIERLDAAIGDGAQVQERPQD